MKSNYANLHLANLEQTLLPFLTLECSSPPTARDPGVLPLSHTRWGDGHRTSHVICGAQCQMKIEAPSFKKN